MRAHKDTVFHLARDLLFGCPAARRKQRIDDAAEARAQALGRVTIHRAMSEHYERRAADLDPYAGEHVAFAEAMEHRRAQLASLEAAQRRLDDAAARLLALQGGES